MYDLNPDYPYSSIRRRLACSVLGSTTKLLYQNVSSQTIYVTRIFVCNSDAVSRYYSLNHLIRNEVVSTNNRLKYQTVIAANTTDVIEFIALAPYDSIWGLASAATGVNVVIYGGEG